MIIKRMKETNYYESPSIVMQQVELECVIATSNDQKFKVSADTTHSKEETWVESDFGGNYGIDM